MNEISGEVAAQEVQKKMTPSQVKFKKATGSMDLRVELDFSVNMDGIFASEMTRMLYNAYTKGKIDRARVEPGAFILVKMTNDGFQISSSPRLIDGGKHVIGAIKGMNKRHPGEYHAFFLNKASTDYLIKKNNWDNLNQVNINVVPNDQAK